MLFSLEKEMLSFGAALINLGDIMPHEIRQLQMDKYCVKYMDVKKTDIIGENRIKRKHWLGTPRYMFSARRKLFVPEVQRAGNKRLTGEGEGEGNKEEGIGIFV